MSHFKEQARTLGCGLTVLAGVGFYAYWMISNKERHDLQQNKKELFATLVSQLTPPSVDSEARNGRVEIQLPADKNADIRGKVLVVSIWNPYERHTSTQLDDIFFKIPEELRATTPTEVSTVIYLVGHPEAVGKYSDGETAWRSTYMVYVIDKASNEVKGGKFFPGGDPPARTRSMTIGNDPTDDIVAYISTLPRRLSGSKR